MEIKEALVVVDVQKDFCPGGKLAVPRGDTVVEVLNKYINFFRERKGMIFASRDWHPPQTGHFKQYGGKWPMHCVQDTDGAAFHPELQLPEDTIILSKGMDPEKDSYSVFQAEDSQGRGFLKILKSHQITELCVGGLATDYCVRHTVLDALGCGLKVKLLSDATLGVDEESSRQAVEEMVAKGAELITFDGFLQGYYARKQSLK